MTSNTKIDSVAKEIAEMCLVYETLMAGKDYPESRIDVKIGTGTKLWQATIWYLNRHDPDLLRTKKIHFLYKDTYKELVEAIYTFADELPSGQSFLEDSMRKHVAAAIELGEKVNIPTGELNPLRQLMEKLSSNILTKQAEKGGTK